jgi:hypothetical protein
MTSEWVSAISEATTGVFTALAVGVAYWQLNGIRKGLDLTRQELILNRQELKMASLMAVLEIETQMNERKVHFDKCSAEVRMARHRDEPEAAIRIHAALFSSAKENYFNALDRLCFCILKDYLIDKDWRAEYRNAVQNVITTHPDDFNEASQFRNIKNLNKKWQEE